MTNHDFSYVLSILDKLTGGDVSNKLGLIGPGIYQGAPGAVYGPGQAFFDAKNNHMAVCRAKGAYNQPSQLKDKSNQPTLHCSSFTNMLSSLITGQHERYNPLGTAATLADLLETIGYFKINVGSKVSPSFTDIFGLGAYFTRVRSQKNAGNTRVLKMSEIYKRREEFGPVLICLQSSGLNTPKPKWGHHTLALINYPTHLLRVAADGWKNSDKSYSGTPMDCEIISESLATGQDKSHCYEVWQIDTLKYQSNIPLYLEF